MELKPYIRKVHYYETDQMGIVHHSNYIRWFEEARVDLMEQVGYTYAMMEAEGIGSPVLAITCDYQEMVRFGETVEIEAFIKAFSGAKMAVGYVVRRSGGGQVCTTGESLHCFIGGEGHPVTLKRENPEVFRIFQSLVRKEDTELQW